MIYYGDGDLEKLDHSNTKTQKTKEKNNTNMDTYTSEQTKSHFGGFDLEEENEFGRIRKIALEKRNEMDLQTLYWICLKSKNKTLRQLVLDLPEGEFDTSDHELIEDGHLKYFGFL